MPFLAKKVVVAKLNSDVESSTAPTTDDESVVSGQATPVPPQNRRARDTRARVCPVQLRRDLGQRLGLKKGRRTQQRCDNEKLLMAMYGVEDESILGEDIVEERRSHFQELLNGNNQELLNTFVNNEEPKFFSKPNLSKKGSCGQNEEDFEPEEAFLSISANLRHALKKNLPLGMLEGLEAKVNETFMADPNSEFLVENLSSYERLLVHALCAYNALHSHSFDYGGKRIVRVENPYGKFFSRDPSLCKYLTVRGAEIQV